MTHRRISILMLIAAVVCLVSAGVGGAVVITVDDSGSAMYTSIQAAIDAASPSDEIHVNSGTYYEVLNVNKQLILRGIDTGAGMPVVDAGGRETAILLKADYIILDGFMVTNAAYGIFLDGSNYLTHCNYNTISGNNVSNIRLNGIQMFTSSHNTLIGNSVMNNPNGGIALFFSSINNTLINNIVSNNYEGIRLFNSGNTKLIGNMAYNNWGGIRIQDSSNNELNSNTVSNNSNYGIWLYRSNNNIISNNYFNNPKNVLFGGTIGNQWNITKTSGLNIVGNSYLGGNFWASFSQTCADVDMDGICDSIYSLNSDNVDYLPLAATDTTFPTLIITSPIDGATITSSTITVSGTASDDTAIASVTVNGIPATGTTTWSADVTLIEDTNTIIVVATDTSGNSAADTIIIYYTPTNYAEITSASFDTGYFAENDKIKAHVTVKNNGDVTHTFYVGYSVQDPNGKYYDAPYKSITLFPGQTDTVDIDWTVPWINTEHLGSFKAITAVWEGEISSGLTGQLDTYVKENAFTIARYNGGYLEIKSITPNEATRGVATLLEIEFKNEGDKPFIESDATVTIQEMDSGRLGGGDQINYIAKEITIPTINPGDTYTWKFGIYDGIYFGKILTDYITVKVEPENGEIVNSHPDVKPFDVHPNPIEYIDVTAGVIGTLIGNGEVDEHIKNILKAESTAYTLTNIFTVSAPNKDFKSVGINIGKLIIALKPNPVSVLWSTTSTGLALSELILYHGGQDLINGIVEIFSSIGEDIGAIFADCPINLMIIDEYGNRLGIDENGTIYEEIPDSSVIVIGNDTNKSILLIYPASGNYTTIVSGTDNGTFDMLLAVANNGNVTSVNYSGILTTNNSIAKVQINDTSDYSITIDSDGDGVIDNVTSPSSLLIYQVPEVIISEPINGTQYEKDTNITLQGFAYDQYQNIINSSDIHWSSNMDGVLGIGNNINISNLSVGKHIIYLKAIDNEGHYGINNTQIEIQPKMGGINATSLPSNASILLDGVPTGQTTPYLFTNISEGIHQIEIKLSDYNDFVFDLNVSYNNISNVNAIMDLDIYPPEIFICSPSNGTTTNSSVIALNGTIENNAILNINDQIVSVVNNSFNVSINLQTGINIITMTASDTSGNNATDTITITYRPISGDFSGELYSDWNLISTPLLPVDTSIASVLSPISGKYSIIWAYNASDSADHWKKYDPLAPFGNDLITMESGKGYWIMMTSDDILNVSGIMPAPTYIELRSGWNLMGYNSLDPLPITDALSSISGNYSIVWAYNASDGADHWKKYDPLAPFGNDLEIMKPGKGYWIMMKTDDILMI